MLKHLQKKHQQNVVVKVSKLAGSIYYCIFIIKNKSLE